VNRRTSVLHRLVSGQLVVAAAGVATFILVASAVTPALFTWHLTESGETDQTVQTHARESLVAAFLAAGVLALVVSGFVAVILAVVAARRVARPLQVLAEAATRVDSVGVRDVDDSEFSTEMQALYLALVDMSDRLARDSSVRNQLLTDLAHELRTPLASLEAHVDALEDGMIPSSADSYSAMREEIARLRRLALDVRTAAAAQEHALDLELLDHDLHRVTESAYLAAAPRFMAKGVDLKHASDHTSLQVHCDSSRIQQVLANLLDNALRHTAVGGSVSITSSRAGQFATVVVSDDGDGIPPEQLDRIFERFFRADGSRATFDGNGSGLGLTIAQAIIRDHGGELIADSDGLGTGTKFVMRLPVSDAGTRVGPPSRVSAARGHDSGR
jgi:signal transduction histidine kinase